jgi:chloramphenicol 3-O phosphotransferase
MDLTALQPLPDAPGPQPLPGRVILLHGASSAGKSTLARAVQAALNEPFLHISSDHLVPGLPKRREPDGPFQWWGHQRTRFFEGFHRCLPALADAGNDLIVDHVMEFAAWRQSLATLLARHDVFLVGVHCALDELDRRERVRGDRTPGEGRAHVVDDHIHSFGPCDLDLDTTGREPAALAQTLLQAWHGRARSALFRAD